MSTICFIWEEDLWYARVKLRMGKLFHGEINEVSWAQNNGSPAPNKTSNSLTFGIPLKYPTSMKLYLTEKIGTSPPLKDVGFTNPSGRELIIWIVKFPIAFYNIIRLQRSALHLLLLICSAKSFLTIFEHSLHAPHTQTQSPSTSNNNCKRPIAKRQVLKQVDRWPNFFLWRPERNK